MYQDLKLDGTNATSNQIGHRAYCMVVYLKIYQVLTRVRTIHQAGLAVNISKIFFI